MGGAGSGSVFSGFCGFCISNVPVNRLLGNNLTYVSIGQTVNSNSFLSLSICLSRQDKDFHGNHLDLDRLFCLRLR